MQTINKLVFVIEYLRDGGAERVTAALANEICKHKDWQVHVITYEHNEEKEYPLAKEIIRHNLPPLCGSRLQNICSRVLFLKKTIHEIAPVCVVSLASIHVISLLSLALVGSGTPLILSERNDPEKSPRKKVYRFCRFLCYMFCHGLVFQTNEAQRFFPQFIRNKSVVICNPLTGELPMPWSGEREKRVVNFCRLVPQKNLDLLIDAFSDLAHEFSEYVLDIYGDGSEKVRLQEKIAELNLTERVRLKGYSSQIHKEILNASMFVSSSDYEGISNSMLEAIAIGVPTICTDCPAGGAREIICNGKNGLLVPVGNRVQLAEAMRRVMTEPNLAKAMSTEGYRLRETLSTDVIALEWLMYVEYCIQK